MVWRGGKNVTSLSRNSGATRRANFSPTRMLSPLSPLLLFGVTGLQLERLEKSRAPQLARARVVPNRNNGMLVIFFLEGEKLLVLIGLPARGAEFSRQQPGALEKFFVVELRVHTAAGKNHQAAAASQVVLNGLHHRLGEIRHIGEDDTVKIVKAGLRKFGRGD